MSISLETCLRSIFLSVLGDRYDDWLKSTKWDEWLSAEGSW